MERNTEAIKQCLFTVNGGHAYAILDGASIPDLLGRLCGDTPPPQHECLFLGTLEPEMMAVAPYLVRLEPEARFTDWLIDSGWGRHWGIFARSQLDFRSIRYHFRALTGIYDEAGQCYRCFRYYDPRVLRSILPACQEPQLAEMFGPVEAYLLEGDTADEVLRFTQESGQLEAASCHGASGDPGAVEPSWLRVSEPLAARAGAGHGLANIQLGRGRSAEAVAFGDRAIVLNPRYASSPKVLARAHINLGEFDRAAQVYRDWLADEPDNPIALHQLAACTGEGVPERAADDYVEMTFDAFASSFDARLAQLNYRGPEQVAEAVGWYCAPPARQLNVLDAGCGTGLCGLLLAPYARRLVGVDLSEEMLARAAPRQVYDELVKSELSAYLERAAAAFDVVVSADALCYFGALEAVMQAAHGALGTGGLLVFTLEEANEATLAGYRIHPHGRYSHTESYVAGVLAGAGFGGTVIRHVILRTEGGHPVASLLVIARKLDG